MRPVNLRDRRRIPTLLAHRFRLSRTACLLANFFDVWSARLRVLSAPNVKVVGAGVETDCGAEIDVVVGVLTAVKVPRLVTVGPTLRCVSLLL